MKRLALVFPGQGSQHIGMGKTLYDNFQEAKDVFEEANDILGYDLRSICFEGSINKLSQINILFPAILTVSFANYKCFEKLIDAKITVGLGHSLGEFSALTCSGVIAFKDALKIVEKRGDLIKSNKAISAGIMDIIQGINESTLREICTKTVEISCFNAIKQFAISGEEQDVIDVEKRIIDKGGRVTPLITSPPMHCKMINPIIKDFKIELIKYQFNRGDFDVISNFTALPYRYQKNDIISNLTNQLVHPVQWQKSMDYIEDLGIDTVIELGSNSVLTNLTRMNKPHIKSFSFEDKDDFREIKDNFSNLQDSKIIERCLMLAITTKSSDFSIEEYSIFKNSYKRIDQIQRNIDEGNLPITKSCIYEVLKLLRKILTVKGISNTEQNRLIDSIMDIPLIVNCNI